MNRSRKGKTLRATKLGGDPVRLHRASDEFEEAAFVVSRIAAAGGQSTAAVLYRMNAQSRLLEEALMRQRIPYVVIGGVGFYERKEVKDLVAYLRLLLNPDEPIALRRVIERAAARDRRPHAAGARAARRERARSRSGARSRPPSTRRSCPRARRSRSRASAS